MSTGTEPTAVVRAWIAAWNARDDEALEALADERILLETPRGVAHGRSALRELVARQRYGVRLHVCPADLRARGETVVAIGPIELRQVEEDDRVVHRQDSGAAFTIRHGRVTRFKPYPDAATALEAEGFTQRVGSRC